MWILITRNFLYLMESGKDVWRLRQPRNGKAYALPKTWQNAHEFNSVVVDLDRQLEPQPSPAPSPATPPPPPAGIPLPPPAPTKGIGAEPPFWPQTDNFTQPDRTCNSSATAMALKALGYPVPSDDDFLRRVLKLGDSTDHGVVNAVCRQYGANPVWSIEMTFAQLDAELAAGRPVVIAILHRGLEHMPTGGHVICVWAKVSTGYRCHDPYGSLHDGYTSSVTNGKGVIYTFEQLRARWTVEGDGSGYGRVFR